MILIKKESHFLIVLISVRLGNEISSGFPCSSLTLQCKRHLKIRRAFVNQTKQHKFYC